MALIQGSKADIVSALNRESAVTLDETGLYFSPVQAVDGGDPTLTRVRVTALDTYQYRGSQVISYHRLRLDDLPNRFLAPPRLLYAATLYELLPNLVAMTGVNLTTDDVADAPVTDHGDGTLSVALVAKASSLGWVGQCVFSFNDLPPLSLALTTTEIGWS